jgi:hypothetical protein
MQWQWKEEDEEEEEAEREDREAHLVEMEFKVEAMRTLW